MTYNATELSSWDGSPVELYEFRLGASVWRHTSADQAHFFEGWDYQNVQLSRTKIEQGVEINRSAITVTAPRNHVVANLFLPQPPGGLVTVTVRRLHRTDVDVEAKVVWMGRIVAVRWSGSHAIMQCEPVWSSVKQAGLRRRFNPQCPFVLYDTDCRVNVLTYQLLDAVSDVTGLEANVAGAAAQADGYYTGGYIVWHDDQGAANTRWIIEHAGTLLTMAAPMHGMVAADNVEVYPGCARNLANCAVYGNTLNYGGWPFQTEVNPFTNKLL